MTRAEFLSELAARLSALKKEDRDRSLEYYGEAICDRMEDGMAEEEAVSAVGTPDEAAAQILADIPGKEKKRRTWVWIAIGAPIWLPVLAAAASVLLALAVSILTVEIAVVLSLYALFLGCAAGSVLGCAMAAVLLGQGRIAPFAAWLGAGLICAGLSILLLPLAGLTAKGCCLSVAAAVRKLRKVTRNRKRRVA